MNDETQHFGENTAMGLSIRVKLFSTLSILSILTLIGGIIALYALNRVGDDFDELNNNRIPSLISIGNLKSDVNGITAIAPSLAQASTATELESGSRALAGRLTLMAAQGGKLAQLDIPVDALESSISAITEQRKAYLGSRLITNS